MGEDRYGRPLKPAKGKAVMETPGSSTDPLKLESEDIAPTEEASRLPKGGEFELGDLTANPAGFTPENVKQFAGGDDATNLGSLGLDEDLVGGAETAEAEAGVGAEGAIGAGAEIAEAEEAVAPLDAVPGLGEAVAIGAGVFGLGEAMGWWGGGHKHHDTPIQTTPHMKPAQFQVASNNVNPSYRSFQRAYASPTINTGIMR